MQLNGGYSEIGVVVIWIVDLLNYCAASGKKWLLTLWTHLFHPSEILCSFHSFKKKKKIIIQYADLLWLFCENKIFICS